MVSRALAVSAFAFAVAGAQQCTSTPGVSTVGVVLDQQCGNLKEFDCCARCFGQRPDCVAVDLLQGCCIFYGSATDSKANSSVVRITSGSPPGPPPSPPPPTPPTPPPAPPPAPTPGQASFVTKDTFHQATALEFVIVPPDCGAAVYSFETGTFAYNVHSEDLTSRACNDPFNHAQATLNATGVSESCAEVRQMIQRKASMYAPGADESGVYDPHGTGKGYKIMETDADDTMTLIRLAGVGGKGLKYYQDTVVFDLQASASGGCDINSASQSQVSAGGDGGTNLCNIYNLLNDLTKRYGQLSELSDRCCTNSVQCFSDEDGLVAV